MAARSFQQDLVCVFGQPVAENPTQAMIERAFQHHGLDWRYLTIEVAPHQLADAVRGLRAMNFRGGNLTIPHKVNVIQHLDGLTDAARLMGAVNCMIWRSKLCNSCSVSFLPMKISTSLLFCVSG